MSNYSLAIHGGAGTILLSKMSHKKIRTYTDTLKAATKRGETILKEGGTALEAVEACVIHLEDSPLFNAGKGAVFTHEGKHEMDAAIMCGKTLDAGAVASISNVRNPIQLCTKILHHSKHIFLSGKGAEAFAKLHELEFKEDKWFYSDHRYKQLERAISKNQTQLDHSDKNDKYGTVGAVALDKEGNLAAATSTGGMTNKKYGRIGDSPMIGVGTYASNETCAISCTGHGEYYMKAVLAYDIVCLMKYKELSLEKACDEVINKKLVALGGSGGLIAVDKAGNIALPFNSKGMYRAWVKEGDNIQFGIE